MKNQPKQAEVIIHQFINDITTIESTKESPAYLVDKRLINSLLSKITKGNLYDIKNDLNTIIRNAKDKNEMFQALDEYIYLNKVIEKIEEVKINETIDKTVDEELTEAIPVQGKAPYQYSSED